MGPIQDTTERNEAARGRRLGWRVCLRKGCGRRYRAAQWNQRYCQEPDCLRLVRRWQAAKRQRERRASVEVRRRHAEAERARRQRSPRPRKPASSDDSTAVAPGPGAWSRSETPLSPVLCNRPGCYEPPRLSRRTPARYCGDPCRDALRQVRDRERKYLHRKTIEGRRQRRVEYAAAAKRTHRLSAASRSRATDAQCIAEGWAEIAVRDYRRDDGTGVTFRKTIHSGSPEDAQHDPEADSRSPPRAPPAEGGLVLD